MVIFPTRTLPLLVILTFPVWIPPLLDIITRPSWMISLLVIVALPAWIPVLFAAEGGRAVDVPATATIASQICVCASNLDPSVIGAKGDVSAHDPVVRATEGGGNMIWRFVIDVDKSISEIAIVGAEEGSAAHIVAVCIAVVDGVWPGLPGVVDSTGVGVRAVRSTYPGSSTTPWSTRGAGVRDGRLAQMFAHRFFVRWRRCVGFRCCIVLYEALIVLISRQSRGILVRWFFLRGVDIVGLIRHELKKSANRNTCAQATKFGSLALSLTRDEDPARSFGGRGFLLCLLRSASIALQIWLYDVEGCSR